MDILINSLFNLSLTYGFGDFPGYPGHSLGNTRLQGLYKITHLYAVLCQWGTAGFLWGNIGAVRLRFYIWFLGFPPFSGLAPSAGAVFGESFSLRKSTATKGAGRVLWWVYNLGKHSWLWLPKWGWCFEYRASRGFRLIDLWEIPYFSLFWWNPIVFRKSEISLWVLDWFKMKVFRLTTDSYLRRT